MTIMINAFLKIVVEKAAEKAASFGFAVPEKDSSALYSTIQALLRSVAAVPRRVLFKPPLAKGVGGFAGRMKSPVSPFY